MFEAPALERLLKRERVITLAGLTTLCVLAWLYIVTGGGLGMSAWEMTTLALFPHQQAHDVMPGMPGMDMGAKAPWWMAWGFATWALMIAMWWIMMIAMMTPSAAPTILLYARVHRHALAQGQVQDKRAPTGTFAVGYLLVWLGFAAAATTLQWVLEGAGLVSATGMGSWSRWLSGAILITAGLYQLSPLKNEYLPGALPHAHVVSFAPLASARPGCAPSRRNARRVLCRLLLDADGAVVRRRRNEPGLDRRACHSGADRESTSPGPLGRPRRRRRASRLGCHHARGIRTVHHCLDKPFALTHFAIPYLPHNSVFFRECAMKPFVALKTALSGPYLARAIAVMMIVGSVLNLINQGEALFQGAPLNFAKLLLTYVVPFCVSTYGTWSALITAR